MVLALLAAIDRTRNPGSLRLGRVPDLHFILRTNSSEERAHQVLQELQALRIALISGVWHGVNPQPDLAEVVAFDQAFEVHDITDFRWDTVRYGEGRTQMVFGGANLQADLAMADVEGFNLAKRILLVRPFWVLEGLAMYGRTILFSSDRSTATLGSIFENYAYGAQTVGGSSGGGSVRTYPLQGATLPPGMDSNPRSNNGSSVTYGSIDSPLLALARRGRVPASKLFAFRPEDLDKGEDYSGQFNNTAWLAVHYLLDTHATAFRDFLQRLGRAQPQDSAWAASFPDLPADKLDEALGVYLQEAKFGSAEIHLGKVPEVSVILKTPLSEAEIHGMKAQLYLDLSGRRPDDDRRSLAEGQVKDALATDAAAISALEVKARWDAHAVVPAVRAATVRYPQDPRAWALLGRITDDGAEKSSALATAARLGPDNAVFLRDEAQDLVDHGKAEQAVPIAGKALGMDPGDPRTLHALARALSGVGQACRARDAEARAVDVSANAGGDGAQFKDALASYKKQCEAASGDAGR